MRSRNVFLTCIALLGLFRSITVSAAPLPQDHLQELRLFVFSLINESRRGEGLPPFAMHEGIERVAQAHAEDSAEHFNPENPEVREQSYLGHTSSDGRALNARYRDAEVDTGWAFAENAGYWIRSPFGDPFDAAKFGIRAIHAGMMAEVPPHDGHRQAILGPYTHVGIGLALLHGEETPTRQKIRSDGEANAIFLVTDFSQYLSGKEAAHRDPDERWPSRRSLPRMPAHGGLFFDVPPDHAQAAAITRMQEHGIIQGYPDGTFQPRRSVNRAEMLKMLLDVLGFSPIGREFHPCFQDVNNEWFAPYVCVAKREGWVTGYPDDTFHPERFVTRAEAVTLLARMFDLPAQGDLPLAFDDVPAGTWFTTAVARAGSLGLLPFPGPHLLPEQPMLRGEVAEILAHFLE